jgi:phage/plasmid-like protein (TIGR03299 family)
MAHELNFMSNGQAAMAFVGQIPWHGLGQRLTEGASIDEWREQAGLNFEVLRSGVKFDQLDGNRSYLADYAQRHVLYRSDTKKALSVVSDGYQIHQPEDVLGFSRHRAKIGGFQLETAGVLRDGEKIWGLAKVNDGVEIVDGDVIKPYLLLATSYDGSLATTARFTSIRVVCNNTLQMARADNKSGVVKVRHDSTFDSDAVRRQLGIFKDSWERFQTEMRTLAGKTLRFHEAEAFAAKLLSKRQTLNAIGIKPDVTKSPGYISIMELFKRGALGREMVGNTAYGMLNAVTEHVDHYRGRTVDSRIDAAWFGVGNNLKLEAKELLCEFAR